MLVQENETPAVQENETIAVSIPTRKSRRQAVSAVVQSGEPPHQPLDTASPSKPAAATSQLEAATAVALPEQLQSPPVIVNKRGRPSKADLAKRRERAEAAESAAAASTAAVTNTEAAVKASTEAAPASAAGTAAPSKSSKPTTSRASAAKRKKLSSVAADAETNQEAAVEVEAVEGPDHAPRKVHITPSNVDCPVSQRSGMLSCICCARVTTLPQLQHIISGHSLTCLSLKLPCTV